MKYLEDGRPKIKNRKYSGEVLFLSRNGKPLTRMAYWNILKRHVNRAEIKKHGLEDYFLPEHVHGGVHDKIAVAERILQTNGFKRDNTAYVGDLPHDIRTGRELGVFTVGSIYGWTPEARLRTFEADAYIGHHSELIGILAKS